MSPKPRNKENKGLPKRWRYKNGAYRYQVPRGQEAAWGGKREFTLGKTLPEAYRAWSERLNAAEDIHTVAELFDRYALEVIPTYESYKTRETKSLAVRRLRGPFGRMDPEAIEPIDVYRYADKITRNHGLTSANRDVETLSHILSTAVKWGIIKQNQLLGQVRLDQPQARDRLVTDEEIDTALNVPSKSRGAVIAKLHIRLKLMTCLRRKDILQLKLSDIRADGIHVQPSKTKKTSGKRLIIEWDKDGELRAVIDEILRVPPRRIGDAPLFITRDGNSYINANGQARAFDNLWQRFMDKVEAAGVSRFQERDLRAKVASDSDSLVEASERLGHADTAITQRVYRRKPVRVQPLVSRRKS